MSAVLAKRQRWLYDAIVDVRPPAKPQQVLGGAAVPPELGLSVYRHAYLARLRDCVADDFAAVATVVGEDAFARLANAFIRAQPPVDSTLNAYGRFFPTWLATTRVPRRAQLVELAQLEWALVEAIHAALAPSLSGAELARVAPHAWARIRLKTAPSLQVLPCRFATNEVYEAYRKQRPLPQALRRTGGIAVLRLSNGLNRFALDAVETRVLRKIVAGKPLGEALAGLSARHLQNIQASFTQWVARGFFTALA
jgi:Putative DNA-binding domain